MKRSRILSAVLASILCITAGIQPVSAAGFDESYEVYFSGHGHIDTAWQWTYGKTISDYLFNTWRDQLDLIENNLDNDYKFSASSAIHYEWAKEYYPALYEEIRERVDDGHWDIVGGQWTEAETMLPSGESTVRQFLLGQTFFENEFGKKSEVGFLPDDPSHSWILPQIMSKSGLRAFTATRVSALPVDEYYDTSNPDYNYYKQRELWGKPDGTPHYMTTSGTVGWDNFNWKGVDGTELLSYKPSNFYESAASLDRMETALKYNEKELGLKKGMVYGGSGDRGGGPVQWHHINEILAHNADPNRPTVHFSNLIDYFDSLTENEVNLIKAEHTFENELYYNHELGLYTTHGEMKKYNSDNEVSADAAEKLSSIANWLGAADYPKVKLNDAWEKVLLAQHHDVLPGCSISNVYHEVWNDEEIALNYFDNSANNALAGIASRIDTTSPAEWVPVVVFNSQSDTRTEAVQADVTFDAAARYVKMYDSAGTEIPSQSAINGTAASVTFIARDIPPVGYAVYFAESSDSAGNYNTGLSVSGNTLENSRYKVEINPDSGNISSLLDKSDGNRNAFLSGREMELHLFEDTPKEEWNNWVLDWDDLTSTPRVLGGNVLQSIRIIEDGPVKCTIEITKKFKDNASQAEGESTIKQYVTLYDGVDRVDISMNVDWHEYNRMLKAAFPLAAKNENATFDLSYGTIERGRRVESKREVAASKWADMTDESGDFGTSILSGSKYGWDKYEDQHTLRLSLLRSPKDQVLKDYSTDMGVHDFNFSIYPHTGNWADANTPQAARGLINPLIAYQATPHTGDLSKELSFVSTDADNVVITAVKDAENSDGMIIRLYESLGKDHTETTVSFADTIEAIEETNLIEERTGSVAANGDSFSTTLGKYELKTFRVNLGGTFYEDSKPESIPVDLGGVYNMDGATPDGSFFDGNFNGMGRTLPAELFPDEVVSEDIRFEMGSADNGQNNIVEARSQIIPVTAPEANRIYLLASSINGPQTGNFTVKYADGTSTTKTIKISDWSEYIGGWGKERNTDTLGYFFTHTHSASGNEAYKHANLFVYNIAADSGKTISSITLPNNRQIKIFAISAVKGGFMETESNSTYAYQNTNTTMIDDTDSRIVYGDGWTGDFERAGNYSGTAHYANGENKTVEFTFYGSRIEILSETSNNQLDYDVYIDNMTTPVGIAFGYDQRGQNYAYQQVIFDSGVLPKAEHTIKLVAKRRSGKSEQQWAILDAFRVTDFAADTLVIKAPDEDPNILNNTDSGIVYTGGWALEQSPPSYGRDVHISSAQGDSLSYTFNGTGINLYGISGAGMGSADIYIDGSKVDSIRPGGFRSEYFQLLYSVRGLAAGEHSIRVELTSGTFAFDAFQVIQSESMIQPQVNAVMYDAKLNASYIKTTGSWQEYGNRESSGYSPAIGGTIAASPNGNDALEFTFKGSGVYVISESEPGQSNMDAYLDGKYMGLVNMKSDAKQGRQILFGINGLDPNSEHTLKMVRNDTGGYAIIDAFMVDPFAPVPDHAIVYDNNNAEIQYSGDWANAGNRWQLYENLSDVGDAFGGDVKVTSTEGAGLSFAFTGTGVYILSESEPGQCDMKVYIDDEYVGDTVAKTHELANPPDGKTFGHKTIFSMVGLENGEHTLRLEKKNEGGYAIIDALLVDPGFPKLPADAVIYDDSDAAITYGNDWHVANGGRPVAGYGEGVHYTTTTGAIVELTFTGTDFYVISEGKHDQNDFDVYIDDNLVGATAIKTYKNLGKQVIFGITGLENTEHTAKLVARGYTILDALAVSTRTSSKITGSICEQSGTAIPGATVSVNGGDYTATSASNGGFSVDVPIGSGYTIEIRKPGYETHTILDVSTTSESVNVGKVTLVREGEWKRPDVSVTHMQIDSGAEDTFAVDMGLGGYKADSAKILSGDDSIAAVSDSTVSENTTVTVSALDSGTTDITVAFYTSADIEIAVKNITVTVAESKYTITVSPDITGGTVTADMDSAYEGDTVTLTATPDTGKRLVANSLKYNGTPVDGTTFLMPAEHVTITCEFEDLPANEHTITVTTSGNGNASANKTSAEEGEVIELSETAGEGYHFKEWEIVQPADLTIMDNSFTMPAAAVEIIAIFEEDSDPDDPGTDPYVPGKQTSKGSAGKGASIVDKNPALTLPSTVITPPIAAELAKKAVEAAKKANAQIADIKVKNAAWISLEAFKAMCKAADGKTLRVYADSMISNAVDVRISFNPANATKDINVHGSLTNTQVVRSLFEKWFANKFRVIALEQKDNFGMIVEVAAKVDLTGMDTKNLYFYSYNKTTNKYTRIATNYWIDRNGYLHFTTELAGDIIVSDGALLRK